MKEIPPPSPSSPPPIDLIQKLREYDPYLDEGLINRAYIYSLKMHGQQFRVSGERYFSHPLAVAHILADMHLDTSTIVTGLLHDVVEDTMVTIEEIRQLFGSDIAKLVEGLTKISRLTLQSIESHQAENFRKLLLAMASDIRVLFVKLADRLHNIRTIHHIPQRSKKEKIARETLEIYAPLAEKMGIETIKNELGDQSFQILYPEIYATLKEKFDAQYRTSNRVIHQVIEILHQDLEKSQIDFSIQGRSKSLFSIWQKMQRKNVQFEQLSDIIAFRIVVNSLPECYSVLGILHSQYLVIPGRFKDYISTPKMNGYQSLHTGIIGPFQQSLEVQIRTKNMNHISELGVAAHWLYKNPEERKDGKQYLWLRNLLEILEHANTPEEFLEHTKLEMFSDQVFCFTPQGKIVTLPKGATGLDFAYTIHSDLGDHTTGIRINHLEVPLQTTLQHGDVVEVLTNLDQSPNPVWEHFAVTGKAKTRIRRVIRNQKRKELQRIGLESLVMALKQHNLTYDETKIKQIAHHLQIHSMENFWIAIGMGTLNLPNLIQQYSTYSHSEHPLLPFSTEPSNTQNGPQEIGPRKNLLSIKTQ
jgi:guanosine-3',5'-bis(diphosphate) 3'-pyrophosphohydrolase